ncbi:hypothetical protein [Telluribacter sp. SYSU D00476]|uniref:hypothetical protein n=1 Tax=Telluribacter sp. SYSU D00476 TaxID=2811430 RepID=UPI001FF47EF5|nr:hypothetical protein [Telluribacter sp. SYSU D00476]
MIRAPFSLTELDNLAQSFYDDLITELDTKNRITNRQEDILSPLFDYLLINFEEIIKGRPSTLEGHIPNINTLSRTAKYLYSNSITPPYPPKEVKKWFNKNILEIFDYDRSSRSFTKLRRGELAYKHASRLGLTTCLYCNAQFTFTINKNIKTRPHFDHFLNKSSHPYFALSFYNLIPACYVCNSNIKGSNTYSIATHLHPFIDCLEGLYNFKTHINSVDFLVNNTEFNIILEPCKNASVHDLTRANNSIRDFGIKERYFFHKDYVEDIIRKSHVYSESKVEELYTNYNSIFNSKEEVIEFVLGNYIHADMLHKRILSKLTKDIADELRIIY